MTRCAIIFDVIAYRPRKIFKFSMMMIIIIITNDDADKRTPDLRTVTDIHLAIERAVENKSTKKVGAL